MPMMTQTLFIFHLFAFIKKFTNCKFFHFMCIYFIAFILYLSFNKNEIKKKPYGKLVVYHEIFITRLFGLFSTDIERPFKHFVFSLLDFSGKNSCIFMLSFY